MDTLLPAQALPNEEPTRDACCAARPRVLSETPARLVTLAERLKALSDPTRLRLLTMLAERDESLCVCELTEQFDLHQPTISHHIRILKDAGLVAGEKRGVWSYYWATAEGKRSVSIVEALV